ncbi:MAG: MFS transporter, partial [Anaerolineae bacterium]|nr:MFS transporter [Anaerolineae bacterium]
MKPSPGRVLVPLGLATLLSLPGDLTLYAVLPAYAPALGLGLGVVGLLLSANRIVRLLSNPAVGLLADRWGRRNLFLGGMALGVFSTLSYALFGRVLILFLLGRVLWGIAWSLIAVAGNCMVIDVTEASDRGHRLGLLHAFTSAGHAVSPLLGGILAGYLGFQVALAACAALTAAGFAIALVALPETAPAARQRRIWPRPGAEAR